MLANNLMSHKHVVVRIQARLISAPSLYSEHRAAFQQSQTFHLSLLTCPGVYKHAEWHSPELSKFCFPSTVSKKKNELCSLCQFEFLEKELRGIYSAFSSTQFSHTPAVSRCADTTYQSGPVRIDE